MVDLLHESVKDIQVYKYDIYMFLVPLDQPDLPI